MIGVKSAGLSTRKVWIDQAVGAAAPGGFVTSGEDPEFLEAPPEAPAKPPGTCRTELLNMNFMSDSFTSTSWPLLWSSWSLGNFALLLLLASQNLKLQGSGRRYCQSLEHCMRNRRNGGDRS